MLSDRVKNSGPNLGSAGGSSAAGARPDRRGSNAKPLRSGVFGACSFGPASDMRSRGAGRGDAAGGGGWGGSVAAGSAAGSGRVGAEKVVPGSGCRVATVPASRVAAAGDGAGGPAAGGSGSGWGWSWARAASRAGGSSAGGGRVRHAPEFASIILLSPDSASAEAGPEPGA